VAISQTKLLASQSEDETVWHSLYLGLFLHDDERKNQLADDAMLSTLKKLFLSLVVEKHCVLYHDCAILFLIKLVVGFTAIFVLTTKTDNVCNLLQQIQKHKHRRCNPEL
jgi:hypothetical protein